MLNPFLQPLPADKRDRVQTGETLPVYQLIGHSLDTAHARPTVGLWVGRLLIRMGEKLTKEDIQSQGSRQNA